MQYEFRREQTLQTLAREIRERYDAGTYSQDLVMLTLYEMSPEDLEAFHTYLEHPELQELLRVLADERGLDLSFDLFHATPAPPAPPDPDPDPAPDLPELLF